jgi:hypothetical protein
MIKIIFVFLIGMLIIGGVWSAWYLLNDDQKLIVFTYLLKILLVVGVTALISAIIVFLF